MKRKDDSGGTAHTRFWTVFGAVFVLSCIIRLAFFYTGGRTGAAAVLFTGGLILFQSVCGAVYLARLIRGFALGAPPSKAGRYISLCAVLYCAVTLLFSQGYIKDMLGGAAAVTTNKFVCGGERDRSAYDSGYPFIVFEGADGSLVTAEISYDTVGMLKGIPAEGTAENALKIHSDSICISYYPNTLIISDIKVLE